MHPAAPLLLAAAAAAAAAAPPPPQVLCSYALTRRLSLKVAHPTRGRLEDRAEVFGGGANAEFRPQ